MKKIPVSLIIDDSGVADMSYFHGPSVPHQLLVPTSFAKAFAALCRKNGIKGKFSVVPMPGCLGRIDEKLNRIPPRLVKDTIRIIRNEIEPIFSITSEILTHYRAYDLKKKSFLHVFEDVYFSSLSAEEIADYVGLSLEILRNVGLTPTGVTSPWYCGIDNEQNYAEGIGMAFRKVMKADRCFYFLHSRDELKKPVLMCDSKKTGRVVSIPNNTFDAFACTTLPATVRDARKGAKNNIDRILSPDGKTGMARDLFEQGLPIILISHWQRLYSDGRLIGLEGLDELTARINRVFGRQVEWMTFQELAETC